MRSFVYKEEVVKSLRISFLTLPGCAGVIFPCPFGEVTAALLGESV